MILSFSRLRAAKLHDYRPTIAPRFDQDDVRTREVAACTAMKCSAHPLVPTDCFTLRGLPARKRSQILAPLARERVSPPRRTSTAHQAEPHLGVNSRINTGRRKRSPLRASRPVPAPPSILPTSAGLLYLPPPSSAKLLPLARARLAGANISPDKKMAQAATSESSK